MNIENLGWNAHFAEQFKPYEQQGLAAARVVRAGGGFYSLLDGDTEKTATLAGHLRHVSSPDTLPVVGDWVIVDPSVAVGDRIQAVLPRRTALKRAAAGSRKSASDKPSTAQVLAANVDTAVIVSGLDRDYNPRRIERYLTLVYESGATPVIALNKSDLCAEAEACRAEIEAIAFGVPVLVTSALSGDGLGELEPYLRAGQTLVLLGSSGAGKSTLLNRIAGAARQSTSPVSTAVGKGVHTTSHRELFPLPGGALVIDTPGLRELHLWGESRDGLESTFPEIAALAKQCRFSDCRHDNEPGCAVRASLMTGELDAARLESYLKQQTQLSYTAHREDLSFQLANKKKWKSIRKEIKRWRRDHGADN
ncbi:MAG TPA: ribosome small subunit-dependent GTPase A [Desulfuromonadales bacterium]|nr:ribosome small subunit-dependent GTPase A [Desulfuromonadales bacterium]